MPDYAAHAGQFDDGIGLYESAPYEEVGLSVSGLQALLNVGNQGIDTFRK